MDFTKSREIGIVACPGAESFAASIIDNLRANHISAHRSAVAQIAKRYGLASEEVIRQLNFSRELISAGSISREIRDVDVNAIPTPTYQVNTRFTRFANGELKAEICSSVRHKDIFVVADVENHYPQEINRNSGELHRLTVNDYIMLIFIVIDASLGAGASSCTLVVPTYPYARQHKKKGRESLTSSWFAKACEFAGVSRIITLDVHSKAVENSLHRVKLENLHASYQILRELSKLIDMERKDLVVVAPDTGSVERNKFYANSMALPLAILYKERDYSKISSGNGTTNITSIRLLGDVEGKTVFMADDLLGTGGTLIAAMKALKNLGAADIITAVSLPLFSENSWERFDVAHKEGLFSHILGTDAVFHDDSLLEKEWYTSVGISQLFAETIDRLHRGKSLSPLLDNTNVIRKLFERESRPPGSTTK